MLFQVVQNDITKMETDAIVNAANSGLQMSGSVCGAIFRAAGETQMQEACNRYGFCSAGEAVITPGFNLPAKYVIHTVGPIWRGGDCNEGRLLADCYRNSLEAAASHELRSVAFPSISTGVYSFPVEKAAKIAVATVDKYLEEHKGVFDRVTWVLFDERTKQIYETEIDHLD